MKTTIIMQGENFILYIPIYILLLIKKYQISFKLSSIFERFIFENF